MSELPKDNPENKNQPTPTERNTQPEFSKAKINKASDTLQRILDYAGVKISGDNPWDILVKNPKVYKHVLSEQSMGIGESYMKGWWECDRIDILIEKIMHANLEEKLKHNWNLMIQIIMQKLFNQQTKKKSLIVGKKHYDIGNDLYTKMLDSSMSYSCGYWKDAKNLEDAQWNKLDLICRKLGLKPGMKVLDIGCGWGGMAIHAAKKYGVEVVGITISKEQQKLAQERAKKLPIEIKFQDHHSLLRSKPKTFDRIISIGMFEHIGQKNYKTFFKVANHAMKDDGLLLLHTIGSNKSKVNVDPWINKYIFPHSVLPSATQICKSCEKYVKLEDWHNFGPDYDKTLMAWHHNFNKHWDEIQKAAPDKYDARFKRMWNYYLLMCAGLFRAREIQLWQAVFSKHTFREVYNPVR
jgi:cyclopropane-fatty-acyl-phospholipid synthase